MDKQKFKSRWESNDNGGGITFDHIAGCAISWGLYSKPKVHPMDAVRYSVLKAAGVNDVEDYNPDNFDDE